MSDDIGARFWFKLVGLVFAFGAGGILLFLLVDAAWYKWGGLGALLFFFALLLGWAYFYDRRQAKAYEDLEA